MLSLSRANQNTTSYISGLTLIFKSKALLLGSFLMLSAPINANSSQQSNIQDSCSLTVGWGEWRPYQTADANGQPEGIQIDLIKQIASVAKCELKFIGSTFTGNQNAIRNGSIDLTLDTTVTKERKAFGLFSEPYRSEVLALYLRPNFIKQCESESLSQLVKTGIRIGVTTGNIYGDSVTEVQNNPKLNEKLIYNNENDDHYELLRKKQLDGLFEDPAVLAYMSRRYPEVGQLKICKVTRISSPVSLMFSKKTVKPEMVERFNQAIREVKKTEIYQQRWAW